MQPPPVKPPVLLVIDDEPAILHAFKRVFTPPDVKLITAQSAREGVERFEQHRPDVVVLDVRLPDESGLEAFRRISAIDAATPVIFITGHGTTDTAIEAIKDGALDYLFKPLDLHKLREAVETAFEVARSMRHADEPRAIEPGHEPDQTMVGRSPAMQEIYKAIGRLATQDIPVLILGESGTGKELVARAIWRHSHRAGKPFLPVNCAAIPESLIESELFGHERGAFTGADRQRPGKFEQCGDGTLFLDEIGEMTPAAQAKILRVLQEQRFERVGGQTTIQTNVRLIAATNRTEEKLLTGGQFRTDLYYRLSVSALRLPPLRQRPDDLEPLTEYFLARFRTVLNRREVTAIAPATMTLLRRYDWPGNVRELQSAIKHALLNAAGPVLLPDFLPERVRTPHTRSAAIDHHRLSLGAVDDLVDDALAADEPDIYCRTMDVVERELIQRVLAHTGGSQLQAAKRLGISRGTLRAKMRSLGIAVGQTAFPAQRPDSAGDAMPRLL